MKIMVSRDAKEELIEIKSIHCTVKQGLYEFAHERMVFWMHKVRCLSEDIVAMLLLDIFFSLSW